MSSAPSPFVWYELMTTDTAAALRFYQAVLGWTAQPHPGAPPDSPYLILSKDGRGLGGLMTLPPDCGPEARPGWVGYIGVEDVDAVAARIAETGGAVHKGPQDIPGVGRFAAVSDPSGAVFMIIAPIGQAPEPAAPNTPGLPGWRELYAAEGEAAMAYYADLFGWTQVDTHDMGPMGLYRLFAAGAEPIGGVMTRPPAVPVACWNYYFNVESVDAAVTLIQAAGGEVLNGPHQVPGPMWIAQCRDPQGAEFAVVGAQ